MLGLATGVILNITVPLMSTHVLYGDNNADFNSFTSGAGVELVGPTGTHTGFIHLNKDSLNNSNNYFYFGKQVNIAKDLKLSFAGFVADNYQIASNPGLFPISSIEYKNWRVATTWPFQGISSNAMHGADFFTLQYIHQVN